MKNKYLKESISKLEAYEPEPQQAEVVLNANETTVNLPEPVREKIIEAISKLNFNRYPDPRSKELIDTFSDYIGIAPENIIAGNGLDEVLSIIANTFIEPGDTVISHEPGFSMYRIWSEIAGGNYIGVEDVNGRINYKGIIDEAIKNNAKLIFVCSPNNPTGAKITLQELQQILEEAPSLVILDEAYVDFSDESFIHLVGSFNNLILLRTLSKAFRLAAARCGFACGPVELISEMKKVKSPYNLNALTQAAAKIALENSDLFKDYIVKTVSERERLYKEIKDMDEVEVQPSYANFLFLKTDKHEALSKAFKDAGILVRYYPDMSAFRITVGSEDENEKVLSVIKEALK